MFSDDATYIHLDFAFGNFKPNPHQAIYRHNKFNDSYIFTDSATDSRSTNVKGEKKDPFSRVTLQ